jgi:hypothetical protein
LPREVLGAPSIASLSTNEIKSASAESAGRPVKIADPAALWTVWIDEMAAPLHKAQYRRDAERILLDHVDHDYMYIESPAGEQYAWNHSRRCWERVD